MLSLRHQGVFVAVPLFRVNQGPIGPHPAGSYEIWVPDSSFATVFSYLALNRWELRSDNPHPYRSLVIHSSHSSDSGSCIRSILIHPLTADEVSSGD